MTINKKIFGCVMAVLIISWVAASTVWADNCSKSAELHAQALKQSSLAEKTRLLQQVTVLCPNRAEAWNEIGYIREQQGRLDDAKKQYQRALQVNPSFTASYAGLGDIQNTQKNYVQAAVNYQAFLRQLDADVQNADPYGLAQHRLEYKQKLAVVTAKLPVFRWIARILMETVTSISSPRSGSRC